MSNRSVGPVKGDKKFFEKVKDTVNSIWTTDQQPEASNDKESAKTEEDIKVKIKDIAVTAEKQVISAKARSVKKTTLNGNNPVSSVKRKRK